MDTIKILIIIIIIMDNVLHILWKNINENNNDMRRIYEK